MNGKRTVSANPFTTCFSWQSLITIKKCSRTSTNSPIPYCYLSSSCHVAHKTSKPHSLQGYIYRALLDRLAVFNRHMIVWIGLGFFDSGLKFEKNIRLPDHLVILKPWPAAGNTAFIVKSSFLVKIVRCIKPSSFGFLCKDSTRILKIRLQNITQNGNVTETWSSMFPSRLRNSEIWNFVLWPTSPQEPPFFVLVYTFILLLTSLQRLPLHNGNGH